MKTTLPLTLLLSGLALGPSVLRAEENHAGHTHGASATTQNKPEADTHGHEHQKPTTAESDGHDHGKKEAAGHADEVKLTAEAVQAHGITLATAGKQRLVPTFMAPARVAFNAEAMAHVGSAVRGRAVEVRAKIGQTVAKGDVLLVIESPELGEAQSDLIQKHMAVGISEMGVEPARESYERAKKLYEQNEGIALAEVQKRLADWKAAQGSVLTARAARVAAENKLHLLGMDQGAINALLNTQEIAPKYSVRAPIAGTVIEREVTQGELVNPDRDALLVLADTTVLWVWADVPEARLHEVREGGAVRVQAGASPEAIAGTIAQIAPQIDPATRTGKLRIAVSNAQGHLRPGMFARAEVAIVTADTEPVLAVPELAIQLVEGAPAVFVPVEGEPTTFAKRALKIGKAVGGQVPVLAGLVEGERYVVSGSFVLKADLGKGEAEHDH